MDLSLKILLLFTLMQVKHLFADFYLQTIWMLTGRDTYLHLGRAAHSAIHAGLSIVIFALFSVPPVWLLAIFVIEFVIHFHVDFWKARENVVKKLTPEDAAFWRAMGFDQALHHLTGIGLIWLWLNFIV
ncbi:Protein of unknown function [Shimia gijangensis]|uniref:DUF3307 domain-containing protein n=1 Tax=Shimia gijangensis TaxID=1470563 RepID=A0A1M6Q9K7_9RHOB|nr:DUF3307 domain-containing protein [Shimia gijangensis]SHK16871.1 Protein of unknown function [Shimia gijangensis]